MYQIIESNGKLYQLIKLMNIDQFINIDQAYEYNKYIHCDHILQDQNKYVFCRTIDDIEFEMVEETKVLEEKI